MSDQIKLFKRHHARTSEGSESMDGHNYYVTSAEMRFNEYREEFEVRLNDGRSIRLELDMELDRGASSDEETETSYTGEYFILIDADGNEVGELSGEFDATVPGSYIVKGEAEEFVFEVTPSFSKYVGELMRAVSMASKASYAN